MAFGYNPYAGGLAITPDGICWQRGVQVSCAEEDPFTGFVNPNAPVVPVYNGPQPVKPPTPVGVTPPNCSMAIGQTNSMPPKLIYPAGCPQKSKPGLGPPPGLGPGPTPIRVEPPTPPQHPSAGPVFHWRPWRRIPRPVIRRPHVGRPKPIAIAPPPSELCPVAGYVRRPIAGVDEYQVFRCTPGQPVVIDVGLQTVGRQEALARHGLSGFGDIAVGDISIPTWALAVGAGLLALTFFKIRR